MRKPTICIGENKDADQLRGNREADQRLCFRYTDSTISLLLNPKFQVSNHLLRLYSPVCVRPGRNPKLLVFSCTGSFMSCSCKQLDNNEYETEIGINWLHQWLRFFQNHGGETDSGFKSPHFSKSRFITDVVIHRNFKSISLYSSVCIILVSYRRPIKKIT